MRQKSHLVVPMLYLCDIRNRAKNTILQQKVHNF